ncbi:HAD family phosphatase [Enorma massiliensis]|uniref:HAD family hydrolase n=1 Tax=Enorma massiliensis TaxID=1472761 RepID=UPI002E7687DD|nr:HAD family phosphatase [Enorma massiliensis]
MMVERLIFFDIDGTLVPDTSTGSFIAKRLGSLEQMAAAERAYEEGHIDNGEVCAIDAASWRGYRRAEVESWLDELPLIAGIPETIDACRGAGVEPHLASLAWTVVGEYLCRRFRFAGCCGPVLEEEDGVFTGRVKRVFDEYDKRDYALRVCAERGIDPARCIAVGDSRSDLPLFAAVGESIAFNGSPAARAAATRCVDGPLAYRYLEKPGLSEKSGQRKFRKDRGNFAFDGSLASCGFEACAP